MFSLHQKKKQEQIKFKSEKSMNRNTKNLRGQKNKTDWLSDSSYARIQSFSREVTPELQKSKKLYSITIRGYTFNKSFEAWIQRK